MPIIEVWVSGLVSRTVTLGVDDESNVEDAAKREFVSLLGAREETVVVSDERILIDL